jgi:hypothetical protein
LTYDLKLHAPETAVGTQEVADAVELRMKTGGRSV